MKKKIFLMFIILFITTMGLFHNVLYAIFANTEKLNSDILKVMLKCEIRPTEFISISFDGKLQKIPLPKHSSRLSDNIYLTSSKDFNEYFNFTLPNYGWNDIIQNGTSIVVTNKEKNIKFHIEVSSYTGAYREIIFSK